ncbi:MAG: hypothetical protein Q9167_004213 [Letrouitia subvulpina]
MYFPKYGPFFISLCIQYALTDFIGPTYPAPLDIASAKSLVPAGWRNFSSTLDAYLKKNQTTGSENLSGVENITFSVGLFSVHDPAAAEFQYHYTSPEIKNAPNGTHNVDGNSIYRVASISKLFTVLVGMIKLTNEEWNRPLTEVFPKLDRSSGGGPGGLDLEQKIHWNEITPWALASQIAGVPREGVLTSDILFQSLAMTGVEDGLDPVTEYGFPPVNASDLGPCWTSKTGICGADDFIPTVDAQPPSFLPWTSPAYANDGFILLGLAISNITGKSMHTLYRECVLESLDMSSSYSTTPTGDSEIARSVIPGDPKLGFDFDAGIAVSSGGLLSTINDLAKLGVGILNSTLLPTSMTRKWMKPNSHTASLSYSVGAPWEIVRYMHPSTGKVTDIYTKSGDSGYYSGNIILIPDYGAGFSILSGSANATIRGNVVNIVLDYVTRFVLPAFEAQAAAEAQHNFVGTYIPTDSNSTLNSSLTISFNESTVELASSGLSISSWISNGTDVLASTLFEGIKPRLLPSIPKQSSDGNPGQVAFQASKYPQTSIYTEAGDLAIGPFTASTKTNADWLAVDGRHYAGLGVNLFVFDVDGEGKATAVSPAVTRTKLEKKKN